MRTEWSNKDSLEIPEITAGYGSVSWSDYKTGTSCDSVVLPTVKAIPIEWLKRYAKRGGRIANILFPFEIEMMLEDWEKENEK